MLLRRTECFQLHIFFRLRMDHFSHTYDIVSCNPCMYGISLLLRTKKGHLFVLSAVFFSFVSPTPCLPPPPVCGTPPPRVSEKQQRSKKQKTKTWGSFIYLCRVISPFLTSFTPSPAHAPLRSLSHSWHKVFSFRYSFEQRLIVRCTC